MKRVISKWVDSDGDIHTFVGDGSTVEDCKAAITEQMSVIEDDVSKSICFMQCVSASVFDVS